jgi:co-chaperonin GroES (HSP10)
VPSGTSFGDDILGHEVSRNATRKEHDASTQQQRPDLGDPEQRRNDPGGVIIPEAIEQQYEIGAVIATHDCKDADGNPATRVKAGNLVAYHANSGVRFRVEGRGCRFILESNILAVLEEAPMSEVSPEETH